MSVLEIVLYTAIGLITLIYVIKSIIKIKKGKTKNETKENTDRNNDIDD